MHLRWITDYFYSPTSQKWFQNSRVSVSYLQRVSDFLSLLLLGTLYQPNMCLFDVLGMRLNNQLSLWCIQEQLGQNPTDSTFNFNSIWIIIIWCELQLALTTNVLQRETYNDENISEPVVYYFYWSTDCVYFCQVWSFPFCLVLIYLYSF